MKTTEKGIILGDSGADFSDRIPPYQIQNDGSVVVSAIDYLASFPLPETYLLMESTLESFERNKANILKDYTKVLALADMVSPEFNQKMSDIFPDFQKVELL